MAIIYKSPSGSSSGSGDSPINNTLEIKTDNYNITVNDSGKTILMNSALEKTFNLPSVDSAQNGMRIRLGKIGAGKVNIQAADNDKIVDSAAGGKIYNETAVETYVFVDLQYIHNIVTWVFTGFGSWVVE